MEWRGGVVSSIKTGPTPVGSDTVVGAQSNAFGMSDTSTKHTKALYSESPRGRRNQNAKTKLSTTKYTKITKKNNMIRS